MKKILLIATLLFVFHLSSVYGKENTIQENRIEITNSCKGDATFEVLNKLNTIKDKGSYLISFEKGEYQFYPEHASEKFCFISNHNDVLARIAFLIENKKNITIDGNGSTFIFHGRMIPFLLNNSENIHIKNLRIDFSDSFHSEGVVVARDLNKKTFDLKIDSVYPYELRNNQLIFLKPYYEHDFGQSILYDPSTKGIAFQTEKYSPLSTITSTTQRFMSDKFSYKYKTDMKDDYIRNRGKQKGLIFEQLQPGLIRVHNHKKLIPQLGMIVVGKGEQGENRFAPAFKVNDTKNVFLDNITVNHAGGMGFLFENSENIDLHKCVIEPSQNRIVSTTADASHFVGCRGKISLRSCRFQNQLDDAMNVHGVYQEVTDKIDAYTLGVRVGHFQQLGFRLAYPNDTIGLVRLSNSFKEYDKLTVKSTNQINGRYQTITFNEKIPDAIKVGDLLENLSAYPEVLVDSCNFSRNRARGLLISTPKKTVISNNYFGTEMEAILMPVESSSWYEAGNACNVTIKNNTFQDCTIGGMDRGVICFKTDDESNNIAFNNIAIIGNKFNHFDNLILEISNVDGLLFEKNIITNSGTYPQQFPGNPVITTQYSKNLKFKANTYKGKAKQMIKDLKGGKQVTFK